MNVTWTEADIALLRRLWCEEGLSGGEIATRMPFTRSAIVGKAHRLGLKHPAPPPKPEPVRPAPPPAPAIEAPAPARPARPTAVECCDPPRPEPVRLVDLPPSGCRYAVTPDGIPADQHRFCGAPAVLGKSWCPEHWDVVFVPPEGVRRRVRRVA